MTIGNPEVDRPRWGRDASIAPRPPPKRGRTRFTITFSVSRGSFSRRVTLGYRRLLPQRWFRTAAAEAVPTVREPSQTGQPHGATRCDESSYEA